MSVVKMSKLKIVGLKAEYNKIMNTLTRSKNFEVIPTEEIEGAFFERNAKNLEEKQALQAKISFAIAFLNNISSEIYLIEKKNEADRKKDPDIPEIKFEFKAEKASQVRKQISSDDFFDTAAKEYELVNVIEEIDKISFERVELKSKASKLNAAIKTLAPFENCPLPLDFNGTKTTFCLIVAGALLDENALCGLAVVEKYPSCVGEMAVAIGLRENREKVLAIFNNMGFVECSVKTNDKADALILEHNQELRDLASREVKLVENSISYCKYLDSLKILFDVTGLEIEKEKAKLEFLKTRSTFVAEGWTPTEFVDVIVANLEKATDKFVYFANEGDVEENPPILLKNKKLITPFEDVTNMYSPPGYSELDPNPFMAIFFYVFFGMMIGDAGYGIILTLGCLLALKFLKFESGTKRLIALIGICGTSAIIWGVLFGGVFSIQGIPALWFNPIEEPILMLITSIAMGAIQLMAGYALLAVKLIRQGKVLDAILDTVFMFMLFFGIGAFALSFVAPVSWLTTCGIVLLVGSLVGIVLTNGRHKKGILNKIMGGLAGLYGLVNVLSDVLSYARLFGLGLASGAIGLAFNTLGGLLFGIPIIGYALGMIILIPLHAFNLGIGVLGAYVHNSRLQFLEFYGKFYDGGGALFNPMGEKTKYITINY